MRLFNTASRKVEEFSPENPKEVKIYTCGPTVYSTPHIGNFAAYVYWDLLIRALKAEGFLVRRMLNLTDVGHLTSDGDSGEDKLEKGAKKEGKTVWEIADFYIEKFKKDFRKLDLTEPEKWARATDYIEESKKLVEKLIENGMTYETSDGVYFDTAKFPDYGKFARLDLDNLKAGARVEFNQEKRSPSDFAVWKFIRPGENHAMRWDFLGRPGYPGWHLECSTIIHAELGEPIDIHTGGVDHIPVHHTNEIAQTFGAFGMELAKVWLHCNFLTIDGEKISKSIGNIITVEDLEKAGYSGFDFKMWLCQGHYRSERNFTFDDLRAAKNRRLKWKNRVAILFQLEEKARPAGLLSADETSDNFVLDALKEDLNSAEAFMKIDSELERFSLEDWKKIDELFGLDLIPEDLTGRVILKIRQRNEAREKKDFSTADKLRDELFKMGVTLLDSNEGTFWQLSE